MSSRIAAKAWMENTGKESISPLRRLVMPTELSSARRPVVLGEPSKLTRLVSANEAAANALESEQGPGAVVVAAALVVVVVVVVSVVIVLVVVVVSVVVVLVVAIPY